MGRYQKKDHYHGKAKKEGFVARSAFKLEEIDRKHRLFKNVKNVLDLGCSPGSWTQYALRKMGRDAYLAGVDIEEVTVSDPRFYFVLGDLFEIDFSQSEIQDGAPFDLFMSDAMVKTSGIPERDCARSIALVEKGLWGATEQKLLKPNGRYLAKIFQGPGFEDFLKNEWRPRFKKTIVERPKATRQKSRELYLLGIELK